MRVIRPNLRSLYAGSNTQSSVRLTILIRFSGVTPLLYPTGQVLATKTASRPRPHSVSSATEEENAPTLFVESDGAKPDAEVDDLAAARAQLKARAGGKGKRSSRPGRGTRGHGQVRAGRAVLQQRYHSLRFGGCWGTHVRVWEWGWICFPSVRE